MTKMGYIKLPKPKIDSSHLNPQAAYIYPPKG